MNVPTLTGVRKASIFVKLLIILSTSVLAVIGVGLFGAVSNYQSLNDIKDLNLRVEEVAELSSSLIQPISRIREISLSTVMAPDENYRRQIAEDFLPLTKQVDRQFEIFARTISVADAPMLHDLMSMWARYKELAALTRKHIDEGYREAAFINANIAERQQYRALTEQLVRWQKASMLASQSTFKQASSRGDLSVTLIVLLSLAATLLIAAICYWISQLIIQPLEKMGRVAKSIAQGDFDQKVGIDAGNEIGLLGKAIDSMSLELSSFYQNLEDKVRQRTLELEKARQVAETANRAKSDFLANMSHEIRTPMNSVLGFTELLKGMEQEPKKARYINNIFTSGKALLELINDILDLSKIEAGKIEIQYSSVSLRAMFKEAGELFASQINEKLLRLELDISEDLPEFLILDKARLRQVLINLTGNALKFTSEGQILLSASWQEGVAETQSIGCLRIIVRDSGKGIPPGQVEKIFMPFEQTEGQKVAQHGGTGLGLAISKRLTEAMGGTISVSSVLGEYTEFTVVIENVEIALGQSIGFENEEDLDVDGLKFDQATVLIVDDIDFNRELMASYLESWEFTLLFGVNGIQAIDLARQHLPQLILLDMKMPTMNGYEASEILKKDPLTKAIPLVAVTASALTQDEEVISRICDGYLRKPVTRHKLLQMAMKFLPHTVQRKDVVVQEERATVEFDYFTLFEMPVQQITDLREAASSQNCERLKALGAMSDLSNPALRAWLEHNGHGPGLEIIRERCDRALAVRPAIQAALSNFQARLGSLRNSMHIGKNRSWGEELTEIGGRHQWQELADLGRCLQAGADSFDSDQIASALDDIERRLQRLAI